MESVGCFCFSLDVAYLLSQLVTVLFLLGFCLVCSLAELWAVSHLCCKVPGALTELSA